MISVLHHDITTSQHISVDMYGVGVCRCIFGVNFAVFSSCEFLHNAGSWIEHMYAGRRAGRCINHSILSSNELKYHSYINISECARFSMVRCGR